MVLFTVQQLGASGDILLDAPGLRMYHIEDTCKNKQTGGLK
jgi:hypothetical protein